MTRVTCPHFKGRPSSELYRVQGRGERDEPERGDVFVGVDVDHLAMWIVRLGRRFETWMRKVDLRSRD